MKLKKGLLILLTTLMMFAALPLTALAAANVLPGPATTASFPTALTLFVGERYQLTVPTTKKVKWKSGKTNIATVTQKGMVTARKAGKTTIKATAGKTKYKCKLTVLPDQAAAYVVQAGVYNGQYNLAKQFIKVRDYVSDAYWTYNKGTYTIIAGTFTNYYNAVQRRNYLLNNGISASIEYR